MRRPADGANLHGLVRPLFHWRFDASRGLEEHGLYLILVLWIYLVGREQDQFPCMYTSLQRVVCEASLLASARFGQ